MLPNESLALHIHSNCIDDEEKEEYKKAIKEYYVEKYISNNHIHKRNTLVAILLAIVGMFILGVAIYVEYQTENPIWTEFIDIIAWVLIWEAVDIVAFRNREMRMNNRRYLSYIAMKIRFFSL